MADTADERPDPDALLKTLDDAARRAVRGKLRVYFGASAGVGKTYAMLVAARAQAAQGVDVLAGIVETHGRRETAALLDGIPTLPLKDVAYRGHVLKEFDLDGALTRHPALALVDELAHSNAPGSRHAKRWQDIEEMLAAGIDVWTTLNVQHLDSLNEAVGSITGVRVWETVPDEVFDGADEVILVDLSADELLRRLKEGKVYLPEQARHATRNFFRKGNLIALRELALRRTADHVDDDVQAYRRDRAIEPVWRTREAVVACIGADEDAEYVIRSAHRLSQQLECDLHVVTVDTARAAPAPQSAQERLQRAMALADTLGARAETLAGGDMVDAMVRYVRRHNITKAVVGRTRASGLLRLRLSASALLNAALSPGWLWRRHSFADMLAAGCPEIDVIRLGAPPLPASAAPGRDPLTLGQRARQAAEERGSRPWPAMPGRCATAPSPRRCRRWPFRRCTRPISSCCSCWRWWRWPSGTAAGRRRWPRWSAWACSIFLRAAAGVLRGVGRAVPADLRRAAGGGPVDRPAHRRAAPAGAGLGQARGRRPQPV